jgi:hypothetical protein
MGGLPIERPSVIFSVQWISHREHQQKPSAPGIWRLITYFTNSYISYITNKLYPPKKLTIWLFNIAMENHHFQ